MTSREQFVQLGTAAFAWTCPFDYALQGRGVAHHDINTVFRKRLTHIDCGHDAQYGRRILVDVVAEHIEDHLGVVRGYHPIASEEQMGRTTDLNTPHWDAGGG